MAEDKTGLALYFPLNSPSACCLCLVCCVNVALLAACLAVIRIPLMLNLPLDLFVHSSALAREKSVAGVSGSTPLLVM